MVKFISFEVLEKDRARVIAKQASANTVFSSAYYHVSTGLFYWQHICQMGNSVNTFEVVIKSLDDLDKVLLLVSLGIDTKELQEMIDGNCLDTL